MDKNDYEYDINTESPHLSPEGMGHHTRRNKGKGGWYCTCKMYHFIIAEHQKAFPELAVKMKHNPNATNIYSAFLATFPLEMKGKLTDNMRRKIFKAFKLMK